MRLATFRFNVGSDTRCLQHGTLGRDNSLMLIRFGAVYSFPLLPFTLLAALNAKLRSCSLELPHLENCGMCMDSEKANSIKMYLCFIHVLEFDVTISDEGQWPV